MKVDDEAIAVLELWRTCPVADLKAPSMALPMTALDDHRCLGASRDESRSRQKAGEPTDATIQRKRQLIPSGRTPSFRTENEVQLSLRRQNATLAQAAVLPPWTGWRARTWPKERLG